MSAKGEVEIALNWIYILIAGAVILLFFVGIIVQQKSASENYLAAEVVRMMESIFAGAGVSEKTKNIVDASGLADYTLYFDCEEGVSKFGVQDKPGGVEDTVHPLFAPLTIKSTQLLTWSLPYNLPYKVVDFLFITSPNTQYYVFGSDPFVDELDEEMAEFENVEIVADFQAYALLNPGLKYQVRVVDTVGGLDLQSIPSQLQSLPDEKVTMVSFRSAEIKFFHKVGKSWMSEGEAVSLFSLGAQEGNILERDAAKFAAVFAGSREQYECNMEKALERAEYVAQIYKQKRINLDDYYAIQSSTGVCRSILSSRQSGDMKTALFSHIGNIQSCRAGGTCLIITSAQKIKDLNHELGVSCIPLY